MDNSAFSNNQKNDGQRLTNLDFLHEISDGNMEFFKEFIQTFLDSAPESLEHLQKAIESNDWETIKKTAHKIRPSFNYLGLKDLEKTANKLEQYASEGTNLGEIPAMVEEICTVCSKAIAELQNDLRSLAA
ncbi:MAG: hypothetical protein HKN22_04245 [Bacteroidia bacterium]|nr:hypothetical protein [Bacteroidia bacterium]